MKELINHFLKQPLNNIYIERVAFQYFESDYKAAETFLCSLRAENTHINNQKYFN
jgi:hypothetical protein